MKSNKGFTLIELLAVIVILAVIALIATPIIMGYIADARKGAARDGAYHYIDAVENQIAINMMKNPSAAIPTSADHTFASVKGTAPTSASLVLSNGVVTSGTITVDNYNFTVTANGLSDASA